MAGPELDDVAHQAAADAMITIIAELCFSALLKWRVLHIQTDSGRVVTE